MPTDHDLTVAFAQAQAKAWGDYATALNPPTTPTTPPTTPPPTTTTWVDPALCGVKGSSTDTTDATTKVRTVTNTSYVAGGTQQHAFRNTTGNKVIFKNCLFDGHYATCAVWGDNLEIVNCEFRGFGDAMKLGSNVNIHHNWFHDCKPASGDHSDGVQMQDGITNSAIDYNIFDMQGSTYGSNTGILGNAAVFLSPDIGPSTNGPVSVTGNFLAGGGYTLYCVDGSNGKYIVGNITIKNNTFKKGAYGVGPTRINVPITASGNVYSDGSPISI